MSTTLYVMFIVFTISVTVSPVLSNPDVSNAALFQRIQRLEERDRLQQNEIQRFKERDLLQQNEIQQLKEFDQLQQKEIIAFKSQLEQQTRTTNIMESTIRRLKVATKRRHSRIPDGDAKPPVSRQDNMHDDTAIQNNAPVNRIVRAENEMDVAFFATLTVHQEHIGVNQAILFDNVITNIGNSYHSDMGTFIAPVPGIYVFSVALLSGVDLINFYAVSKNGVTVSNIYNDGSTSHYENGGQTFILELSQNDDVNIRNTVSDRNTNGHNFSTFAGFLLKQRNAEFIVD